MSPKSLAPRIPAIVPAMFALLVVAMLSGCTSINQSKAMEGIKPPAGGEMKEEIWQAADKYEGTSQIARTRNSYWILPLQVYFWSFYVEPGGEFARSQKFAGNDLSSPLLMTFLPLRAVYADYTYRRGEDKPIGKHGFIWWPLWTSDFTKGKPGPGLRFKTKGVPIVWSYVGLESPEGDDSARIYTTLWTLGPVLMKFESANARGEQRGFFSGPVLLGGVLGALVWSNYAIHSMPTDEKIEAYGPVLGFLGYWGVRSVDIEEPLRTKEDEGKVAGQILGYTSYHHLLLGTLWHDVERRDPDGKLVKGRYGPLWTGFGWHVEEKDGKLRKGIRAFWIPIRF